MRDYIDCPRMGMVETKLPLNINSENFDNFISLMTKYKENNLVFFVSDNKQNFFVPAYSRLGLKHMLELHIPLYVICNQDITTNIKKELCEFLNSKQVDNEFLFTLLARVYVSIKNIDTAKELYDFLKEHKGQVIIEDDAGTFRLNGKLFSAYEYIVANEYDALDVAICLDYYDDIFFENIKKFERVEKGKGFSFIDSNIKKRNKK